MRSKTALLKGDIAFVGCRTGSGSNITWSAEATRRGLLTRLRGWILPYRDARKKSIPNPITCRMTAKKMILKVDNVAEYYRKSANDNDVAAYPDSNWLQIRSSRRRLHSLEREVKIDLFEWRYDSAQWWLQAGNQAGFLNKAASSTGKARMIDLSTRNNLTRCLKN